MIPVILCGGGGTRLWPLSRSYYPKQFMDIEGKTLFGDTVERVLGLQHAENPFVVCNESQRFFVAAHCQASGLSARIMLEPEARNTAPAIALAAFVLQRENPDALMLVLPSDHRLHDLPLFANAVDAARVLAMQGYIVTFGVTPTKPATGLGYIQRGEPLSVAEGYAVARFHEKPHYDGAVAMLADGNYLWNSGMFMMQASVYLQELAQYAPHIHAACAAACEQLTQDRDFIRVEQQAFLASPADSIDYAVMEHTHKAAVVTLPAQWHDLGSWEAFYEIGQQDTDGNVCVGDILCEECVDCYLHSSGRLVAALGTENMVVVETPDAVLVSPRDRVQDVKKIVERLGLLQRPEKDTHRKVYRPWGVYEVLHCDARFQVKRITVNPQAVLSRQLHYHRAEHWVVVSGTAFVTVGERTTLLHENQSTYIDIGVIHRLENRGCIPLVIIEIQTGSYLGEDDIVRLDDDYGRV